MRATLKSGVAFAAFLAAWGAPHADNKIANELPFGLNSGHAQPYGPAILRATTPLTITGTVLSGPQTIACPTCAVGAGEWTAGAVTTLGANLSLNSGTLVAASEWHVGSVAALNGALNITGQTLNVKLATGGGLSIVAGGLASNWQASPGTVVAVLAGGLSISAGGTLADQFSAGSVVAIGSGLSINAGTLNANTAGVTSASGLASIVSTSTVNVGTTSTAAPSSFILGGAGNVINNTTSTASDNAIIAGTLNVISGPNADGFIGAGVANTVSQNSAAVVAGQTNTASGAQSFVGGGSQNVASGLQAAIPGGTQNLASGQGSFAMGVASTAGQQVAIAMGQSASATAEAALAMGFGPAASGFGCQALGTEDQCSGEWSFVAGQFTTDRGTWGAFVHGGGGGPNASQSVPGTGQKVTYTLFAQNAGALSTRLTTTGGAAAATNIGALPNTAFATWNCKINIVDKTNFPNGVEYSIGDSVITRGSSAATTALGTGNPSAVAGPTTGTPLVLQAAPAITADSTNGGVNLSYTPPLGNTDTLSAVAACEAVESTPR